MNRVGYEGAIPISPGSQWFPPCPLCYGQGGPSFNKDGENGLWDWPLPPYLAVLQGCSPCRALPLSDILPSPPSQKPGLILAWYSMNLACAYIILLGYLTLP